MAPHSSTLAWKISWMEEPAGLQPMGSQRVRHDWTTSLSLFTFMHWRRTWQPTPVFLPGESQGRRSLVGASVHGVARSRTRLSDFTFTSHFHALEKDMATHSSVLAWRIPGTAEPGGGFSPWGRTESDTTEVTQHWLSSRLLPCPGYCKYCWSEHWGTVSSSIMIFSGYMPSSGTVGSCGGFLLNFLRNWWRNFGQFDLGCGHW